MKVLSIALTLVLVFGSVGSAALVDPPSWDMMDLDFGTVKDSMTAAGWTDPQWYGTTADPVIETLSADYSTITYGTDFYGGWDSTSAGIPQSPISYTVEFSARISSTSDDIGWSVWPEGGANHHEMRWISDDTQDLRDNNSPVYTIPYALADRTAWNTYRVVVDTSTGTGNAATVSLFLNGNDTAVASGTTFNPSWLGSGNGYYELWGSPGSYLDVDYLRVASGAWIPEPITLSVLALGGLAMLYRRRR